jgi:hypothetical protein
MYKMLPTTSFICINAVPERPCHSHKHRWRFRSTLVSKINYSLEFEFEFEITFFMLCVTRIFKSNFECLRLVTMN